MAIFNPEFFTNPATSLNTAYGIPTCLVQLAVGALSQLDSSLLLDISNAVKDGRTTARKDIATWVDEFFNEWGILQYDKATGKLNLFSESSRHGLDLGFLEKLANITGQLAEFEDLIAQGVEIWEGLEDCMDQFKTWLDSAGPSEITGVGGIGGGSTTAYTEQFRSAELAIAQAEVETALTFIDECNTTIQNIGTILAERQHAALLAEEDEDDTIFRLIFGPPVSKQGVFILSEDGLYYDSQTRDYNGKDIPSASDIGIVVDSSAWNMNRPPSLGGKGTIVTLEDVNQYIDTLFDINKIDETLTEYYNSDHFLEIIEAQKQKMFFDTSGQVNELITNGYSPDSALVVNHKQSMFAFLASFNRMMDKRKKQIEVAVRSSTVFGITTNFQIGQIPINDFSYLSAINLDISLEQQKRLVFEAGSVDEVVLPIKPLFVRNFGSKASKLNLPLSVPEIGKGSIILGGSVDSIGIPTLSITDSIVSDNLFGIFNFLKAKGVDPGSEEFGSLNCATLGIEENAQLIGRNEQMFASGLGIPLFLGLTHLLPSTQDIDGYGSICRLPDSQEFQNFLYNRNGGSFDCWLHMPNYGIAANNYEKGVASTPQPNALDAAWVDYNYYKILLANENVGGSTNYTVSSLIRYQGDNTVKGMLMGFSRDPVIYSSSLVIPGTDKDPGINVSPTPTPVADTTASSCFFIAPTMSLNTREATFVPARSDCISDTYAKLVIDDQLTVNGKKFADVSGQFMHLVVSFDVSANECRVYLDSELMAVSSLNTVFGGENFQPPRVPTFIHPRESSTSSFYYSNASVNQHPNASYFDQGPSNDISFTPWIIGGGWTDGMPFTKDLNSGGFMGERHGWSSGLGGHVGSVKFYSKPLSTTEVLINFNAQKGFYKNILT